MEKKETLVVSCSEMWLMLKLNKSTLLLEKIITKKFYVISKFKRQGCLGEYKRRLTYKTKFHLNLHPPPALESVLNVKRSKQNRQTENRLMKFT